jgi:hypothetical protein
MQGPSVNPATGDAFEDVLYASESELDDSDDEAPASRTNVPTKCRGTDHGARLRIDDAELMDLLRAAASRITSVYQSVLRSPFHSHSLIVTLILLCRGILPGGGVALFKASLGLSTNSPMRN